MNSRPDAPEPMQMTIAEAREQLSLLLDGFEAGDEVIITRNGVPAVQLILVTEPGRRLGLLEGQMDPDSIPDFLDPMSDDDLDSWSR